MATRAEQRIGGLRLERVRPGFYLVLPSRRHALIRTYWDGPKGGQRILWEAASSDGREFCIGYGYYVVSTSLHRAAKALGSQLRDWQASDRRKP